MGFISFVMHRILALTLTGCALFLGFATWGMYTQGQLESALVTGITALVLGFSAAYFWQTLH